MPKDDFKNMHFKIKLRKYLGFSIEISGPYGVINLLSKDFYQQIYVKHSKVKYIKLHLMSHNVL